MIDPWGSAKLEYQDLIENFGVRPFSEVLDEVPEPSWLMRRGIIFG
ncbi:MAG: tryptophan--tRNA ligase, partial [Methanothermobacter sp.]|nr:tryptophan--tRNA ligase [Methanothermobacter sp.]